MQKLSRINYYSLRGIPSETWQYFNMIIMQSGIRRVICSTDTPQLFEDGAEYPKIHSLPPEKMLDCVNGKRLQFLLGRLLFPPAQLRSMTTDQAIRDRLREHMKMGPLSEDKNHVIHGGWNEKYVEKTRKI
jgi:hypothetical protein